MSTGVRFLTPTLHGVVDYLAAAALTIDTAVAVLFLAAPSLFGFTGIDAAYYWITAAAVFGLAHPAPSTGRAGAATA